MCLQLQPPSCVSDKAHCRTLDDTDGTCSALRRNDCISDAWWLAPYRSPGKGLGKALRSFCLERASHIQGFPEEPGRWSYRSYLNGRLNQLLNQLLNLQRIVGLATRSCRWSSRTWRPGTWRIWRISACCWKRMDQEEI